MFIQPASMTATVDGVMVREAGANVALALTAISAPVLIPEVFFAESSGS